MNSLRIAKRVASDYQSLRVDSKGDRITEESNIRDSRRQDDLDLFAAAIDHLHPAPAVERQGVIDSLESVI